MRPRARTRLRQRWSLCGSALIALHVAVGGARRVPDDKRGELRWLEGRSDGRSRRAPAPLCGDAGQPSPSLRLPSL